MAFYGYNGDADECYWVSHTTNFNYYYDHPGQDLPAYSYHEFNEPLLIENSPVYNYNYETNPEITNIDDYSAYRFSQPKFHQYEPTPYVTGYVSSATNYTISYSTQKLSAPRFEEYDPTPYGGGYDKIQVYGKPLPPSNRICYPLSKRRPGGFSLDGFSFSSIPSPYGKKSNHSVNLENGGKGSVSSDDDDDMQSDTEDEKREAGHGSDYAQVVGNGRNRENGYEFSRQVPQIPYGSAGLEAMDICECLFGHWPCLAKMNQERAGNQEVIQRESNVDPWKSTADYLFGWPFVYGDQNDGGYGDYHAYGHGR